MSRSFKKISIIKDHTGRWYNKIIRRTNKREVKAILNLKDRETYEITNPKTLINDYDVCDFVQILNNFTIKQLEKLGFDIDVVKRIYKKK